MTNTACLPECERNCWTGQDKHAFGCPVAAMFGSAEQAYFGPRAPLAEAPDFTKIQCNCGRSPLHPVSAHVPAPQAEDGGKVGRKVCQKIPHSAGGGYMHDEEHDGPYDVDGVLYCGRCHSWYNNPADHGAPALSEQPRTAAGDGSAPGKWAEELIAERNALRAEVGTWREQYEAETRSLRNLVAFALEPITPNYEKPMQGEHNVVRDTLARLFGFEILATQQIDALRAELAAARDEIAKLRKFVSEAMHEADAEKARADKAEQEYREIKAVLAVTRDDLAKAEQRVREYEELITGAPFGIPEAKRKILAARLDSRAAILREQKEGGR